MRPTKTAYAPRKLVQDASGHLRRAPGSSGRRARGGVAFIWGSRGTMCGGCLAAFGSGWTCGVRGMRGRRAWTGMRWCVVACRGVGVSLAALGCLGTVRRPACKPAEHGRPPQRRTRFSISVRTARLVLLSFFCGALSGTSLWQHHSCIHPADVLISRPSAVPLSRSSSPGRPGGPVL